MRSKILIVVLILAGLGFVGYTLLSKRAAATRTAHVETTVARPAQPAATPEPPVERKAPVAAHAAVPVKTPATSTTSATSPPAPTNEWKAKLDTLLASPGNAAQKTQQLREFLSKLPDPDAEHAVQALTVAVPNESFGMIKSLVVDPNLPEAVRDEFMVDLMNRP